MKITNEMATSTTNDSGLCCVDGNLFSRDITDDDPRTNGASFWSVTSISAQSYAAEPGI